jgi:hypothetical protein
MILGQLALLIAALFAGAALYVSVAEHPARLHLDDHALLTEWKPAYKRGAMMQAPLAMIGFVFGLFTWGMDGGSLWLVGSVLLVANWPYTLLVIAPVNNKLLETPVENAGPISRELLKQWGLLHAVRSALGLASAFAFLGASIF